MFFAIQSWKRHGKPRNFFAKISWQPCHTHPYAQEWHFCPEIESLQLSRSQLVMHLGAATQELWFHDLFLLQWFPGECISPCATKTLNNSLRSLILSTISFISCTNNSGKVLHTKHWLLFVTSEPPTCLNHGNSVRSPQVLNRNHDECLMGCSDRCKIL